MPPGAVTGAAASARLVRPLAAVVVAACGTLALAAVLLDPGPPATWPLAGAVALLTLAALLRPVEPAPGEKFSLAAATAFFGALVLPAGQAALAAAAAAIVARAARRTSLTSAAVNVAALAGSVGAAAIVARGAPREGSGATLALIVLAGATYLATTLLAVGAMVAASRGREGVRRFLGRETVPTLALVALGGISSVLWDAVPLALALLVPPLAIVELAARASADARRKAEELERSLDAQRVLAADAAHELRNPLAAIDGNLAYLESAPLGADERQALGETRQVARGLQRLVEHLILLSRSETVADPAARADLAATARRVAADTAVRPGVRIAVDAPPEAVVGMPADLLAAAVRDVVGNAAAYTEQGTIEVRVDASGGEATLVVADSGIGIPPSELSRVFDRFYRGRAASRMAPGSGLGLAIVRRIVEAHRGDVAIESDPARGTTVTLRLPSPPLQPRGAAARALRPR